MSEVGLLLTGQEIAERGVENRVGRSTFDFLLETGKYVESKFGTSQLSKAQRIAQELVDVEVHYWTYDVVSGIAGSGPAAGLGLGNEIAPALEQSLNSFTNPTPGGPYSGGTRTLSDVLRSRK